MELDIDWYIQHQIYPPTARLVSSVEGLDSILLALSLQLDTTRFVEVVEKEKEKPKIMFDDCRLCDLIENENLR